MGREIVPNCSICRREGVKLFLKGSKCLTPKCPLQKRPYTPGQHAKSATQKPVGYGLQFREKQKVKRYYGLSERQFRLFFERAERMRGVTGVNFLMLLERRLDNVICKMGFALSRKEARQIISHGHIMVNQRRTNIPSYIVNVGDEISLTPKSSSNENIRNKILSFKDSITVPGWLSIDFETFKGKVLQFPKREDVGIPVEEHLIVEFYSR
ncbi:MAG: 30S ribosomal protein S4 [Candidatus Aminicenantia bacterium]